MDLSELYRPGDARRVPAESRSADRGPTPAPPEGPERLRGLLAQVGAEIAGPLTSAVERVNLLTSTGKIDRDSLRHLRDEIESARQAGMIGQQLTRFASGRIRQSHEVLQLADAVSHVLAHRRRGTLARGVSLQPSLAPVEVVVDPSLLFSLLNSTVDWALANTASTVEFEIEAKPWPARARLTCRFAHRPADDLRDDPNLPVPVALDSLTWRLIEQTAWAMGLRVDRTHDAGIGSLTFEFPRSAGSEAELELAREADNGFAASVNSQPLAGSHVLVIASRREMRMLIRDSLRGMSLIVDFVNSVEEAVAFCHEGLPHAVVIEAIQRGERFAQFRTEIRADVPDFVFIEIVEEGKVMQMSGPGGSPIARVGREAIADSLPSALMFELSKGL